MKVIPLASQPFSEVEAGTAELLKRLGIFSTYNGFWQSVHAVRLATQNPGTLILVSKLLYPEVAKSFGVSWCVVERNIRTVAQIAWENNPDLLSELAGHPLRGRPKAAQFIALLSFSFMGASPFNES